MRYCLCALRRLTPIEWLIIVGIILAALAVLLPGFPFDFDAPPSR